MPAKSSATPPAPAAPTAARRACRAAERRDRRAARRRCGRRRGGWCCDCCGTCRARSLTALSAVRWLPGRSLGARLRPLAAVSAKTRAALGSVLFLAVAPGVAAGLVPWLLTGWDAAGDVARPFVAAGAVLVAAGAAVLLHAFGRFVVEGLGTPAPVAPTEHLVVAGFYRYVRNPMYLAVTAT